MPAERAPMRKVREVLRLRHALGVSERQIAITTGVSRSTVGEYLRRAAVVGITWPVPEGLDDAELERRLFTPPTFDEKPARPLPDWSDVHKELKRRAVTLLLLWEEYRAEHPDGYGYSRFCDLYRDWCKTISPTMRQTHGAAEKLFVDFAGDTVPVFDTALGVERRAHIFVAVLGASNYTYAEATFTQRLVDWIGSHVRAFTFFNGVTAQIVSDNLRSGVTKACFYEPAVNRTYAEMAHHYGTAVVPARPHRPKDKSKVEVAVQVVTRWVTAKLRNRRFFSLAELNAAIRELVTQLNARVTRHLGTSRRALFDEIERPALKALPVEPYLYAEWKECRVGLDYHVEVERHYYSVPHALLRETVWARIAASTIEVFHRGNRVAAHMRSSSNRRHTTVPDHMPSSHRRYADWTPERIRRQAGEIGRNTATLIETIMRERSHPEQGFRAAVGIIRLVKSYGRDRLEAACGRALEIGARSFTSVNSILKNNLEAKRPAPAADGPPIAHSNIRGSRYFH